MDQESGHPVDDELTTGAEQATTAEQDPAAAEVAPDAAAAAEAMPDAEAAPARVRRRAPRRDELLAEAVDTARAALAEIAEDAQVGEHLGVSVDDDRLITHRFASLLPGYAGWTWYATLARAPRARHITVCEIGLQAGPGALVAPPWVPYAERVNDEEREHIQAVAEGRVPGQD